MKLQTDRYEDIKINIINLLEFFSIKKLPINPFEIAKKLNLFIIPYSAFGEKANLLMKLSEDGFIAGKKIYYNDKCKYEKRMKYTIMHEVGHYVLGHIINGEEEESEANFFAKYILAPPPLVHKLIEQPNYEDIAEIFDISYTLADYTMKYYQKWRCYGGIDYTPYEQKLLRLFNVA